MLRNTPHFIRHHVHSLCVPPAHAAAATAATDTHVWLQVHFLQAVLLTVTRQQWAGEAKVLHVALAHCALVATAAAACGGGGGGGTATSSGCICGDARTFYNGVASFSCLL